MIPLINILLKTDRVRQPLSSPSPYVIVIEPTRELCLQVHEQGRKFANGFFFISINLFFKNNLDTGVSVAKAYGQYAKGINLRELQAGCNILCATPGRLLDFIEKGDVIIFVLEKNLFGIKNNFF